jgi:predicted Zn-dependent protease
MRRLVAVLDDDPGFDWEVRLIDNDQVANAWALPGGKMAVYSGLLPLAETEAGLATVMAHELAHATERHGTERMSQEVFSQTGVGLLLETAGASAEWADVASLAKDLLISLPYGREQELEADRKGLRYMAAAGYDPREAVAFWRRMSSGGGGGSIELLSTHPSDQRRMDQLEALMGDALAIYEKRRPEGVLGRP